MKPTAAAMTSLVFCAILFCLSALHCDMVMGELGVLRVCFLRVAKCFCFVGLFETTAHTTPINQ
jgi:hypothetical protein